MSTFDTYRGRRTPRTRLAAQLVSDALVRKSSVTDANASYVQRLRVAENATNQEIQDALHELFNKRPQGPSRRQGQLTPQGHSVQQYLQDTNSDEVTSPQGKTTHAAIISSIAISKIQLDSEIKNLLSSATPSGGSIIPDFVGIGRGIEAENFE